MIDPASTTWIVFPDPTMTVDLSLDARCWIVSLEECTSFNVFVDNSYLWTVDADAMKKQVLSGDHELAVGGSTRSKHEGIDDGAFLITVGSTILSVSVVVTANMNARG